MFATFVTNLPLLEIVTNKLTSRWIYGKDMTVFTSKNNKRRYEMAETEKENKITVYVNDKELKNK